MTYPGGFRGWDPRQSVEMLSSLWNPGAAANPVGGTAAGYKSLFTTVRRLVVGRRLTFNLKKGPVSLTVTHFDTTLDMRGLAVGQFNDIRLEASDVDWNGRRFEAATAVLRNAHIRPGSSPTLVVAPVDLTLDVPAGILGELVGRVAPRWMGDIGPDGVARLSLASRPQTGHLDVGVQVDGSTVLLKPLRLATGRKSWTLPGVIPAYRIALPEMPGGLGVTGIDVGPEVIQVSGRIPEWRFDVSRARVEDMLNQLGATGRSITVERFQRWSGRSS